MNTRPPHIIGFDAKRANANRTGLGNYSRSVVEALTRICPGDAFRLYVPRRRANDAYEALLTRSNVVECLPEGGLWRKFSSLWRIWGMAPTLRRDGVELFHGLSNELPTGLRKNGIRSVVTIHDLIFLRHPAFYKPVDRFIYKIKFRHACRVADCVIAASECTKRDIIRYFGTDPSKIEVVYQGCSQRFNEPISEEVLREVRERYGLPEGFLFNVGTIEERKNLLTAVEALKHLPERFHLVAVGKHTPYADKVVRYAEQQGLSDRVHILSFIPFADLQALYALAGCFVYPSLCEGFGIPIIEAVNAGLPVVAATGSCLEETGGPDSLYAAPFDAQGFADAVLRIDADKELRLRMVERSQAYVRQFDTAAIASQIAALYERVLK